MTRAESTRRPHSLQGRLLLLVLSLVTVVWCAATVLTWYQARHELDELLDSHLAQGAAMLVVRQVHDLDEDDGLAEMPQLHRYAARVAFQVWHRGQLVMRSQNVAARPMSAQVQGFSTVEIDGHSWRVFAAQGGSQHMQVFVGEELRSRREILWALMRSLAVPMAVMLPLLGVATWLAIREGLRPLRRLSQRVAHRAPDDLTPIADGQGITVMWRGKPTFVRNRTEAEIKAAMVKSARRTVVLADHTKFGDDHFSAFAALDDIDVVITDTGLDADVAQEIEGAGPMVVLA